MIEKAHPGTWLTAGIQPAPTDRQPASPAGVAHAETPSNPADPRVRSREGLVLASLGALCVIFALLWWADVHFQPSLYSDGVDYVWVARELVAGRTSALAIPNRPPLFPVLIAFVCRLTNASPEMALRCVTLGAGILAIGLTWRLVRGLVPEPGPALLAAGMTAVGIPAVAGLRFAILPDTLGLCLLIGGIGISSAAERAL